MKFLSVFLIYFNNSYGKNDCEFYTNNGFPTYQFIRTHFQTCGVKHYNIG